MRFLHKKITKCDNAGVTKNVSIMWKEYAQSIGKGVQSLTQQEKIQAEVNGILNETRFQTGDAAKIAGSYSGQVSQLSYQFTELKVAIGNAVTPLIQSVLPTVNTIVAGLTNAANAAAQFISAFLGVEIKQTGTAKAAQEAARGEAELAKQTEAAAEAAGNAVAGFDELNIVSKDTGEAAASAPISGGGAVSAPGALSQSTEVVASPEIERAAKKLKKFFDDLRKTLSKFAPLLKGIATGFLAAFGFKWISGAITKVKGLSVFSSIADAVRNGLLAMNTNFEATGKLLPSIGAGFKNFRDSLSTTAKFMIGAGGTVATFIATKDAMKQVELGTMDASTAIANIGPVAAIAAGAAYVALGPAGPLMVAAGLAAGALVGVQEAQEQMQEQIMNEAFYETAGVSLDTLTGHYEDLFDEMSTINDKTIEYGETVDKNKEKVTLICQELGAYEQILESGGKLTEEQKEVMAQKYKELYNAAQENLDANFATLITAYTKHLEAAAEASGQNVGSMIGDLNKLKGDLDEGLSKMETRQTELYEKYLAGTLTEKEVEEYERLTESIARISSGATTANAELTEQMRELATLNLEDKDAVNAALQRLSDTYNKLITANAEARSAAVQSLEDIRVTAEEQMRLGYMSEEEYAAALNVYGRWSSSITRSYAANERDIKDAMASSLGAFQTTYNEQWQKAKDSFEPTDMEDFIAKHLALEPYEDYIDRLATQNADAMFGPIQDAIDSAAAQLNIKPNEEAGKELLNSLTNSGVNAIDGFIGGVESKQDDASKATAGVAKSASDSFAEGQEEHSPAKLYIEHGENAIQGFIDGVEGKAGDLNATLQETAQNASLEFERGIQTERTVNAFTGMFNAILSKTELFGERFRAAINDITSSLQYSVNTASLGADGKISITKLPPIKIPKLATGAVIPPNAQFLAVLGDQRSGRNLEAPEGLIRQIVREEAGYNDDVAYKLDELIAAVEANGVGDIKLVADGRELARAVRRGETSLGYPVVTR